jgi:hypothetical protein
MNVKLRLKLKRKPTDGEFLILKQIVGRFGKRYYYGVSNKY